MVKITEVTRRDIVELFSAINTSWFGRLDEIEFLSRLYNLEELPSTDIRFNDASSDIWQHRINNNDWEDDWIFFDERFGLRNGEDDCLLLQFLCETIHPLIRSDAEEVQYLLQAYNKLLNSDGYEIFEEGRISDRPVFAFQEIVPRSKVIFSSRMTQHIKPIQKILFGSPGTGKSYQIRTIATDQLGITFNEESKMLKNTVKTVFHPEYTYADFMGKLLPLTQGNSVMYKFYPGHFVRILGMAYQGLISSNGEHYLLVIDELNRGNAAAIFGSIFQLLDRDDDGWSSYQVNISEMELGGLFNMMGYEVEVSNRGVIRINDLPLSNFFEREIQNGGSVTPISDAGKALEYLKNQQISIPPNLSIIATINTSDESIYYLDSAFKRRWNWEYVDAPSEKIKSSKSIPDEIFHSKLPLSPEQLLDWYRCLIGINKFIISHHKSIRRIEDKQIGWWFIKPVHKQITLEQVKAKLMFYLWDSVFARNKQLLAKFIEDKLNRKNIVLANYADFLMYTTELLEYWHDSIPTVEEKDDDIAIYSNPNRVANNDF